MKLKLLHLLSIIALLVGFVPTRSLASQADSQPIPPPVSLPDEGPLAGMEGQPNPLYTRLYGDDPLLTDWYQLPQSAYRPSASGSLTIAVTQVATGLSHTCVLTVSGGVKCWGDNWEGKLGNGTITNSYKPVDLVGLDTGIVSIASSHKHTCALTSLGGMKCWGRNWHGELGDGTVTYRVTSVDVLGLTSGVRAIAVGGFHTCALLDWGGVKCWGANWHGQLGDDTKLESHIPVDVVGLAGPVTALAAGKYHTCALINTGAVQCWGYNMYGQLGNNSTIDRPVPQDAIGLSANVTAITAGEFHTCALISTGGILCWGDNSEGQLGDGTTEMRLVPTVVPELYIGASSVKAGMLFTCALTLAGGMKCWGNNWAGQLGDGTQERRLSPVDVTGFDEVPISVAGGDSHTCAVLTTGGVKCWGSNSYGQIGDGTSSLRLEPVPVYGLTVGIVALASGGMHTCALTSEGAVKCWGNNKFGQLGDGTNTDRLTPVDVVGLDHEVTAIAAGGFHTCAAFRSEVRCWGYNEFGQVGDGSRVNRNTPQTVNGISNPANALALGSNHSCAIIQEGTVIKCWGQNKNGQLGTGNKEDSAGAVRVEQLDGLSFSAIAAGERHTCAVTLNGYIKCWGFNGDGQLGDGTLEIATWPVDVLDIGGQARLITAGASHTCTITLDGGMKCWGDNTYGQLGDGSNLPHITPEDVPGLSNGLAGLSAGAFHTCVRLDSGAVKCWGHNQAGQLGDGTTFIHLSPTDVPDLTSGVIGLYAGAYVTCTIQAGEGPQCWGTNGNGQIGDGSTPWQLTPWLVSNLFYPSATINYPSGLPGSFFTCNGINFSPGITTSIEINGQPLSPTLVTDSSGALVFLLETTQADPGSYVVIIDAGQRVNLIFSLTLNDVWHAVEDSGQLYQVPPGIALTHVTYLPMGLK